MKSKLLASGLLACVLGLSFSVAQAGEYTLTYTFGDGEYSYGAGTQITSTFDGTLNGDLITNITNATLKIDGSSVGTIFPAGISTGGYSYGSWTDGAAVISLDGAQNNFLLINSDFGAGDYNYSAYALSITGTAAAIFQGYYGIIEAEQYNNYYYSVSAYDETYGGTGLNSSYHVGGVSAPDSGATAALLGLALVGLLAFRRKLAPAAI